MQRSAPSKVIAFLPLLIGMILQSPLAASQGPAAAGQTPPAVKPLPERRAFDPAAAKRAQQTYVRPPATQAVLTLTADNLVARPDQDINFTLTWNRNVPRVNYHFDWGDSPSGFDTTVPAATHRYAAPGVYSVRVTATLILSAERMMAAKPSQVPSVQSNAVTIDVPEPVQPLPPTQSEQPTITVALTADKTSVKLDDPVSFTATLSPLSPTAQFHFDFGDGNTIDTASNLAAHNYSLPGPHSATVTVVDANGNQQASSPPVEVTVLEPAPPPPVVHLIPLFHGSVVTGQPISVRAILDPSTRNYGFEFDWGDGTPPQRASSLGVSTHIYTTPGSMQLIVTALTVEAYLPPLQSLPLQVQVNPKNPKSWWPPSLGIMAAAGGALILIAVIGWLITRPDPPSPPKTESHVIHQRFRYEVSGGSSLHKLRMAHPSSNIGPLKLSSGMGSEEHLLKFPGGGDTSN